MTRIDNDFHQWSPMAQNQVQNRLPENFYVQNPLTRTMIWQNHSNLLQNSELYPLISQNQTQNRFLMHENLPPQLPRHQMNSYGGMLMNPSFGGLASLEDAISRISLSSSSQLLDHHHPPHQSYSLNRMRSMSAGLGVLRLNENLNAMTNNPYQNRANSRQGSWISDSNRVGLSSPSVHHYGLSRAVQSIPSRANSSVHYYSKLELDQVKGRIADVARTQEGSRFLHKKIDEQRPDQTELVFSELKDHVCELVVDQFANGVIQKFFVVGNEEQITQLIFIFIKNEQTLLNICIHHHGTRAVQKMIQRIRTPAQRFAIVSALKHITVSLSKNNNGHHVIQQCFKCFSLDDTKCLLDEIATSCLEIAMDKSGCCVLQKSLTRAEGQLKDRLLAEVTANALVLSEHPYGNYVVQFILEMRIPHAEASIMERLSRNFVALSMNKYGSNVVEKCMIYCNENNSVKIIQELIHSRDFLDVVQDPFGNYVIQTALLTCKEEIRYSLAQVIEYYHPYLHSHLHGKKVLAVLSQTRGNRN